MRKTDKKTDNLIISALTEACDYALDNTPGFKWLTHSVNYNTFPQSLKVSCYFSQDTDITTMQVSPLGIALKAEIFDKLNGINAAPKSGSDWINFLTEPTSKH